MDFDHIHAPSYVEHNAGAPRNYVPRPGDVLDFVEASTAGINVREAVSDDARQEFMVDFISTEAELEGSFLLSNKR